MLPGPHQELGGPEGDAERWVYNCGHLVKDFWRNCYGTFYEERAVRGPEIVEEN